MSGSDIGVSRRPQRWWLWLVVVLLIIGAAGAGWWARGATIAESVQRSDEPTGPVLAEVVPASVGRSMTMAVTVRQPLQMVAVNHLSGVVTAVGGGEVSAGDALYDVAGTPVIAVVGSVPFYRDLTAGLRGKDVAQLQRALGELGYMAAAADGVFGSGTTAAVRTWQREEGRPVTGAVPLGQLVALGTLPATVSLGQQIMPGAQLAGGEEAVRAPSGQQSFVLVLSPAQEALVPVGASVEIDYQGHQWQAVATSAAANANSGQLEMELTAPDGGPVCGEGCGVLPADESMSILSTVIAVPPLEGLGVPVAAIRSREDASTYVVLPDGTERDVTVQGTGQGLTIIDGLSEGDNVQLSGPAPPAEGEEPDAEAAEEE